MQRDAAGFDAPSGGLWYRRWDTTEEERRIAAHHRSEAARLHAAYEEACAGIRADEITISPLQRHGLGGFPSSDGFIVFLSTAAGTPESLLAKMRCHRAWMMLGESGMEDCPLDLPNISVETYGDETGISVEITTKDPSLRQELQRRAAKDLEHARSGVH